MKVLVIILSALLLGSNLWAEERKVELDKRILFSNKPNRSDTSISLRVVSDGSYVSFIRKGILKKCMCGLKRLLTKL